MTTAEKYADKIIYLVAMHDNIHRRPFLVKLCEEIRTEAYREALSEAHKATCHWCDADKIQELINRLKTNDLK